MINRYTAVLNCNIQKYSADFVHTHEITNLLFIVLLTLKIGGWQQYHYLMSPKTFTAPSLRLYGSLVCGITVIRGSDSFIAGCVRLKHVPFGCARK